MKRALLLLALLAACKDCGTRSLVLDFDAGCPALAEATQARVFALQGRSCGDCACGGCITGCQPQDDTCFPACPSGLCELSQLDDGLAILPFTPGEYAVVAQYVAVSDAGVAHVVGGGCAQVSIQADGTESSETILPMECCAP